MNICLKTKQVNGQRGVLLESHDLLVDQNSALEGAKKTNSDTESIAMDIMGNLRNQREQIIDTKQNVFIFK
jgi:hypothetical protein